MQVPLGDTSSRVSFLNPSFRLHSQCPLRHLANRMQGWSSCSPKSPSLPPPTSQGWPTFSLRPRLSVSRTRPPTQSHVFRSRLQLRCSNSVHGSVDSLSRDVACLFNLLFVSSNLRRKRVQSSTLNMESTCGWTKHSKSIEAVTASGRSRRKRTCVPVGTQTRMTVHSAGNAV